MTQLLAADSQYVQQYFEKYNILLGNITAVATDGAPAMVGRYRGFASLLKKSAWFRYMHHALYTARAAYCSQEGH